MCSSLGGRLYSKPLTKGLLKKKGWGIKGRELTSPTNVFSFGRKVVQPLGSVG